MSNSNYQITPLEKYIAVGCITLAAIFTLLRGALYLRIAIIILAFYYLYYHQQRPTINHGFIYPLLPTFPPSPHISIQQITQIHIQYQFYKSYRSPGSHHPKIIITANNGQFLSFRLYPLKHTLSSLQTIASQNSHIQLDPATQEIITQGTTNLVDKTSAEKDYHYGVGFIRVLILSTVIYLFLRFVLNYFSNYFASPHPSSFPW